jgi:iron(II)-dependent oxidoreductase
MMRLIAVVTLAVAVGVAANAQAAERKPWTSPGSRAGEEIVGPDGSAMVWVPAGKYKMGATQDDLRYARGRLDGEINDDAGPVHEVRISKGFWLGKHEVTNAQYRAYCDAAGVEFPADSDQEANHPVVYVSWEDVEAYCHHFGLVLPTEAQWEYAARGPENRWFPWGNFWDSKRVCYSHRRGPGGTTFPVGSFPAGASWCGALDLAGNAQEFCNDWYDKLYYQDSPTDDPEGPASGEYRCARGGGYGNPPAVQRSAARNINYPDDRDGDFGFRVCITP